MESFIIPNKNKSPNPTTQEQMTAKPYLQSLSVPIKSSWPWVSKVTKNHAFITTNSTPQQKEEKFSTPIPSLLTAGSVSLSRPIPIQSILSHWQIRIPMDKQFWLFGTPKEENARLKSRFKGDNKKIFHKFSLIPIHRTS